MTSPHIFTLLKKRPKLLWFLHGLMVEPQFYETEPAEIKDQLKKLLAHLHLGQRTSSGPR